MTNRCKSGRVIAREPRSRVPLHLGDRVDATTVVTDGFRQLEGELWASNQFLTPAAGTNCD